MQIALVKRKSIMTNQLRIKKLSQHAIIPTKGSRMAAGHDIYALRDGTIPAQRQMLVDTGIAVGLLKDTYGRLAARSGMASKLAGSFRPSCNVHRGPRDGVERGH